MRDASLPVTLIVVGAAWLLWELRLFPDIDWIISGAFVAGGIAVLILDGVNKNSIVIGPFLIGVGLAWFAHMHYWVSWHIVIPALLLLLGILMLVARSHRIPERRIPEPPRQL